MIKKMVLPRYTPSSRLEEVSNALKKIRDIHEISEEGLCSLINKQLRDWGLKYPITVGVFSTKGGVGKSTIAGAIAYGFADVGVYTAFSDLDLGDPNEKYLFEKDLGRQVKKNKSLSDILLNREGVSLRDVEVISRSRPNLIHFMPYCGKEILDELTERLIGPENSKKGYADVNSYYDILYPHLKRVNRGSGNEGWRFNAIVFDLSKGQGDKCNIKTFLQSKFRVYVSENSGASLGGVNNFMRNFVAPIEKELRLKPENYQNILLINKVTPGWFEAFTGGKVLPGEDHKRALGYLRDIIENNPVRCDHIDIVWFDEKVKDSCEERNPPIIARPNISFSKQLGGNLVYQMIEKSLPYKDGRN